MVIGYASHPLIGDSHASLRIEDQQHLERTVISRGKQLILREIKVDRFAFGWKKQN